MDGPLTAAADGLPPGDRDARLLIVGGGSIGERHLRCFQQIGASVALCEPLDERRRHLTEQYGLQQVYADLDQAAARRWHGAVICTPANLHVPHAVALAPVVGGLLIEKPLCMRLEELPALRSACAGKPVGVAYVLRGHPAVQQVRQVLADESLGPLHQVTVMAGQHFPTFRPAYREIYYARRETGGGAIQDAATHLLNLVEYLAGPLEWVDCDYAHQQLDGVEVEDTVHLLGRTGRTLVSLALNQFMAPNELHVQLNAARGSLLLQLHLHRWGQLRHGASEWTWSPPLVRERDELFRLQATQFLAMLAGRESPRCSLDEAEQTLRVQLAALAAGERGQRVRVG